MNHITNDKGETVIAVGMEGSIERTRDRYPTMLSLVNDWHGNRVSEKVARVRMNQMDIFGKEEIENIIRASNYGAQL